MRALFGAGGAQVIMAGELMGIGRGNVKERNKSALFVVEHGSESARPLLRGQLPASGLRKRGWRTKSAPVLYAEGKLKYGKEVATGTYNGWNPGEMVETFETPKFIIARPMLMPGKDTEPPEQNPTTMQYDKIKLEGGSNSDVIKEAREHGQYFFMDLDDDIWNIPKWNPAYQNLNDGREGWIDDCNNSDGVIVSTWSIWFSATKSRIRVPIFIAHNSCDWWNYPVLPMENDPLRIAWIATMAHRGPDLEAIANELRKALHGLRNRVEFWHVGADFDSGRSVRELLRPFPVDIVERPWQNDLADTIAEIDCAIIPSQDILFNQGRSNNLGLRLAAAGKPFLSSPMREYVDLEKAGIPCLTDNFEDALRDLIEDKSYRQAFRAEVPRIVEQTFSPTVLAREYEIAFEAVCHE